MSPSRIAAAVILGAADLFSPHVGAIGRSALASLRISRVGHT